MKKRKRYWTILDDPCLKVPQTHPRLFAAFYLPVVASIMAASIIGTFSWVHLFFPGFWCFVLSCVMIRALTTGIITDQYRNKASRRKTPVDYWLQFGLCSAAYLIVLTCTVGFALLERHFMPSKDRAGIHSPAHAP